MSKEQKVERKFVPKNVTDIIAILTVIVTIVAFLIRGFWYIYELGYFKSIGVNRIYIEVDNIGTLYYLVDCLGLAGIFIASNYFVRLLVTKKRIKEFILFLLFEVIIFWFITFVYSNVNAIEAITEMIKYNQQEEYFGLFINVFLIILLVNLYGFCFGILENIEQKKQTTKYNETEGEKKEIDIKKVALFSVLVIMLEGFATFFIGVHAGHNQKAYKVIVENITTEDIEKMDEKYVFDFDNNKVRVYPVLYENNENYIISNLCWSEKERYIETMYQKVISKEGIETIYIEDIFTVREDKDTENGKQEIIEWSEDNKMVETLVGAVIGAIIGGLTTYYVEVKKRKKQNMKLESYSALILYYDLKSIEQYMIKEDKMVNMRYSNEWQTMVAKCTFLSDEDVMYLYRVYDEVYKYSEFFEQKLVHERTFKKDKISSYKELQKMLFNNKRNDTYSMEYKKVLDKLEKVRSKSQ